MIDFHLEAFMCMCAKVYESLSLTFSKKLIERIDFSE